MICYKEHDSYLISTILKLIMLPLNSTRFVFLSRQKRERVSLAVHVQGRTHGIGWVFTVS